LEIDLAYSTGFIITDLGFNNIGNEGLSNLRKADWPKLKELWLRMMYLR